MQGRQRRRANGAACPCIVTQTVPAATPRAGRQAAAAGGAGGERSEPPASIKRGGERAALCATRKPGYLLAACHGCNVGTARRAVMLSTRPGVRPRDSRRARCARWPAYQQRHRAAPTRPGPTESNLMVDPRPCRCRAGILGTAIPRPCRQLAANLGRCPSPRHTYHTLLYVVCELTTHGCCGTLQITVTGIAS